MLIVWAVNLGLSQWVCELSEQVSHVNSQVPLPGVEVGVWCAMSVTDYWAFFTFLRLNLHRYVMHSLAPFFWTPICYKRTCALCSAGECNTSHCWHFCFEDSDLVGCDIVRVVEWFLCCRGWSQYITLKCWEPLTHWHSATSQETGTLSYCTVKSSKFAAHKPFSCTS